MTAQRTQLTVTEQLEMMAMMQAEEYRLAEESLSSYIHCAWDILEPGKRYLDNWHIDYVAEHLEAVTDGQIRRLIINIPPRYMKSIEVTVCWPTWEWIRKPELRYLFASYASDLSTKHSLDRRNILESEWYKYAWGRRVKLAADQNVKSEYKNTRQGVMVSTSVGGKAVGKGGDRIIIDDPVNPEQAYSDAERETANRWFSNTISTRLDDKKLGAMVLVMQRLHENDLTGYILAEHDNFVHIKIEGVASRKKTFVFPLSGREKTVYPDDLLWPEREGPEEIAEQRTNLGIYNFEGQYQQEPSPPEGGILKKDWWVRYIPEQLPRMEEFSQMAISVDCNFKDKKSADRVAIQVWGRHGPHKYLLDQRLGTYGFLKTVSHIEGMLKLWPWVTAVYVEDTANGPAVIETLKQELSGIIPITPEGNKESRVYAVSPMIEAGNVAVPANTEWAEGFIEECGKFPTAKHDDQVDAMTQMLLKWRYVGGDVEVGTVMTMGKGVETHASGSVHI